MDDDTQHTKAVKAMERIGNAQITMPYGVILETATVLSRNQSKELANKFVEYVRANPQISTSIPFVSEDMEIFRNESDRLAFVDALLKEMALRSGFVLVSFDRRLLDSLRRASRKVT